MENDTNLLEYLRLSSLPISLLILIGTLALARFVENLSHRFGESFADRRLVIHQVGAILRFSVFVFGFLLAALSLFRITNELLLAIGGTLAVAVGFATKDLAASVLAGLVILIDRPFQVGDRVTFQGYYGEITHIGLRSIRLMTLDDTAVSIPNNRFLTDEVASANAGEVDMMVQMDFYVGIDQDVVEARRVLSEALTTSRYVQLEKHWSVTSSQVIEGPYLAVRLRAKAYVVDVRFEKAFETDVTQRTMAAFNELLIRPPAVLYRSIQDPAAAPPLRAVPSA